MSQSKFPDKQFRATNKMAVRNILLIGVMFNCMLSYGQAIDCRQKESLTMEKRRSLAKAFENWKSQAGLARTELNSYTLPIVFHVLNQSRPTQEDLESLVVNVNAAFSNTGAFEGERGADTQLRFCLAKEAPDGTATAGINYINSDYRTVDVDLEHADLVRHVKWDRSRYINVWLVDGINGEAFADYTGRDFWTRLGLGGYATNDGVVMTGTSTELLVHELGHYFGLLHTWEGRDCKNDDCLVDGDMVCDTPPDRSVFNSCNGNSCTTDILSDFSNGFFMSDTVDMGTNFMDYGNGECSMDFSLGQAEKMQFTIDTNFPNLPLEINGNNTCTSPCDQSLAVQIERNLIFPSVGETVTFTGLAEGDANAFEWYVGQIEDEWTGGPTGTLQSTTQNFDLSFAAEGYYTVYFRAWNATDSTCLAATTENFRVTCGVNARFSPDKRVIASKQPHALFTDSVTFTNNSFGASEYEWTIRHQNFESEGTDVSDSIFNDETLTYYFREPGAYQISLVASDGTCRHSANTFSLDVFDPTMDGIPSINQITCNLPDRINIDFTVFNNGYDTIRANTPVTFYTGNPLEDSGAILIGKTNLSRIVYGFESEQFSVNLEYDLAALSEVYIVFNDTGQVDLPIFFPLGDANLLSAETTFPITGFSELTYDNNVSRFTPDNTTDFLDEIIICEGDSAFLQYEDLIESPICWDSVVWNSNNQVEFVEGPIAIFGGVFDDQINLMLFSSSGISASGTVDVVTRKPEFSVDTVFSTLKGSGVQITILQQGEYTYEWSPEIGLSDPFSNSTLAAPEENTLYTVMITDEFGCVEEQDIQVWVETTAYIPSLFTPNQDGSNDLLRVYDLFEVQDIQLRIVNKEGILVYTSNSADELRQVGWDGQHNGRPLSSGAYFWSVQGSYEDGREVRLNGEQSGVVHLIR